MNGIGFVNIPGSGLTAPIFSFEVNSGGQYQQIDRLIYVGHKTAAGSLPLNTLVPVADQQTVDTLAGPGSMLREMFRVGIDNAPAAPFYLMAVADLGTTALWNIAVGALPSIGVGTLVIEGEYLPVTVGPTDTPASIASALAAAINGYYNVLTDAMLPVTAQATGAAVTVTARHAGAIMNEVDFFVPPLVGQNLFAAAGVLTVTRPTDGAGTPIVGPALAALMDDPADYVVSPWTDALSMSSYDSFSNDTSGRWAWNRQSYGHVWTCRSDTFAGHIAFAQGFNSRHISVIGRIHSPFAAFALALPTNPVAGQTITVAGTVVIFGAAAGQVAVGATVAATLVNLLAFLQSSTDAGIGKFGYTVGTNAAGQSVLNLTAITSGTLGNWLLPATTVTGAAVTQTTVSNGSPHASWLWAAGITARLQPWLSDCTLGGVSRAHRGLVVQDVLPPRDRAVWPQYNARNALNNNGTSTFEVGRDGSLQISKIVTLYRTGRAGQPDIVFRDVQALYQTAGSLKYLAACLAEEQSNKGIADENPGGLDALTTPSDVKSTFVHGVQTLQTRGVLKQADVTTKQLVVAVDGQNPDRINVALPLSRVNPFDILAANATVYQQLADAA